jgi:UDP-glucose 4-epimerase
MGIKMDKNHFANKEILVTGGLGFIASNLVKKLVEMGAQVTVLDNLNPKYGGNLQNLASVKNKISIHVDDIINKELLARLLPGKHVVFHLAAQTSHMDSMSEPLNDLDMNAKATLQLLELTRQLNPNLRLVITSTRQIYGQAQYLPVDENHPINPIDINGIHKLAIEQYATLYFRHHQIKSTLLRLTNVYGPGIRIKDARQMFLGVWIRLLLENKPFEVWGGDQLRDLAYVNDVCDALLLAAGDEKTIGQIYNIGSGSKEVSLLELAETLVNVAGKGSFQVKEYPLERRGIEIGNIYLNDEKFRNLTGWKHQVTLEQGLQKTLEYYQEHLKAYQ